MHNIIQDKMPTKEKLSLGRKLLNTLELLFLEPECASVYNESYLNLLPISNLRQYGNELMTKVFSNINEQYQNHEFLSVRTILAPKYYCENTLQRVSHLYFH